MKGFQERPARDGVWALPDQLRRAHLATILGATALTSTLAAAPAHAQEGEATASREAIIVTAQRRSEALEDVPMSITVLSQDTLASAGVSSIRDLTNVTTGFQVGNGGSYPQPSIRGITTINAGSYENNVALFVDGLYQTTPQVLNMDLPNVQSIQILKGPQGTLYGRNATGGAILMDTIDPGNYWEGQAELTYARFDDKRARGYVAGPITDGIGLSLAGTIRRTDGYFKKASRSVPGEFDGRFLGLKQESFRAKLKFDISDNFRATLGYNYTRASDPRGVVFTPIENVSSPYTQVGNETRPRGLGEVAGDIFEIDYAAHEGMLKLEFDTGIGTLRSVTGYTRGKNKTGFDFFGSYVPDLYSYSEIIDKTWQESVDFTIDAIDNLDLVIGGTYYNIKTAYDPDAPNTSFLGPAFTGPFPYPDPATTTVPLSDYLTASETDFFRTKEAWAIFADATFHATDRLSITLGGRYSKETQDVSGIKFGFGGEAGGGPLIYDIPDTARSSSYKKFTPRASIRYEITPGTNVYASYSKGFRGGEWNSVIPSDNPDLWFDVQQETVDAFEVGFKHAGNRLRFEAAAFYYDYKDLQVSFTSQVEGIAVVILQNAPSAEIYGAEASFDYEVVDNFNIRGGVTWLHARYGDNFMFTGSGVNQFAPAFNTNSDPLKELQNITVEQDLSGLQMSRAPDFAGFLGFDYLIPKGDGGLRFSVNAKYTDSYVVTNPSVWGGWLTPEGESAAFSNNCATDPTDCVLDHSLDGSNSQLLEGTGEEGRASKQRARQGNYVLLNASVTWTDPTDSYYVRVWGNNLTDQKYRQHYNPLAAGAYMPIAEPLTYGVTIGYKFGGN